jgi:hypothetical protein
LTQSQLGASRGVHTQNENCWPDKLALRIRRDRW